MTTPKTATLLPCPFCGSESKHAFEEGVWHLVRCENRKCGTQSGIFPTRPMAIRAWNTRAPAQCDVLIEQEPLDWLTQHKNYELSYSGWDEDAVWQVHSVNSGRNDREWTLLATGDTPEKALRKAMSLALPSAQCDCAAGDTPSLPHRRDCPAVTSTHQPGGKS